MPKAQREACTRSIRLPQGRRHCGFARAARRTSRSVKLWRADINALYSGSAVSARRSLAGPIRRSACAARIFAVIDGMEMDIHADIARPDWATLDAYCDRVASAVGALRARVRMEEKAGVALAYHLAVLCNYEYPARHRRGCVRSAGFIFARGTAGQPVYRAPNRATWMADPRIGVACEQVVARAREHFRSDRIMDSGAQRPCAARASCGCLWGRSTRG